MVNNYYLCNVLIKEEEMKTSRILFLITILATTLVSCNHYDMAVENADGVTIYYNLSDDGNELTVTSYRRHGWYSYSCNLVIPEEVTYKGVTRKVTGIDAWSFSHCRDLNSLSIPSSVTNIEIGPFEHCYDLISIIIDAGNPKYDSRDSCNAIIETESNKLIAGCKNTIIPSSVTSIGSNAFNGCFELTSITIPNSVTSIGEEAFASCGLTSITIPNSVTSIGECAFWGCNLTSISIGNNVKYIGDGAFCDCILDTLMIPGSVMSIGERTFESGVISEIISMIENPFAIDTNTFSDSTYNNATLYVPKGTIEKYKAQEGWKKFVNIKEK